MYRCWHREIWYYWAGDEKGLMKVSVRFHDVNWLLIRLKSWTFPRILNFKSAINYENQNAVDLKTFHLSFIIWSFDLLFIKRCKKLSAQFYVKFVCSAEFCNKFMFDIHSKTMNLTFLHSLKSFLLINSLQVLQQTCFLNSSPCSF